MKMKKIYKILLLKRTRLATPGFTIQTQREFHWLRRAQESKERQKKRRLIMC